MKMFLAGADGAEWIGRIAASGHPYMLASYYNVFVKGGGAKRAEGWVQAVNALGSRIDLMLDSGLFTMMFGAESNVQRTEAELLDYTKVYLETVRDISFPGTIVEMDVHKVLGMESLPKFRKMFLDSWPAERTLFVWHTEEGTAGWAAMAKRYPYIALSIPELRRLGLKRRTMKTGIMSMLQVARDANPSVRIHLLGNTDRDLLNMGGYTSCDSTSWMSEVRFMTSSVLYGLEPRKVRKGSASYYEALNKAKAEIDRRYLALRKLGIDSFADTRKGKGYSTRATWGAMVYSALNRKINEQYYDNEAIVTLW